MRSPLVLGFLLAAAAAFAEPNASGTQPGDLGFATEELVCAPHVEVWDAVFTPAGMRTLGVAQASVEFRVGGLMMRRFEEGGTLGDDQTIVQRIVSLDYGRMISLQPVRSPGHVGPLLAGIVSVYYFTPVALDRTLVRVVTRNVPATPEGRVQLQAARAGTRAALETLRARYRDGCTVDL